MERYDGKTRKDDTKKYILIGMTVLIVVLGLHFLTRTLKKNNTVEPDYVVAIGCSDSIGETVAEEFKNVIGGIVGDLNGDGKTIIEIDAYKLVDNSGTGEEILDNEFNGMNFSISAGETILFLLSDEPSGAFKGAATAYCEQEYFASLPEDLADSTYDSRTDLTNAPFLQEIGFEDVPFYGCIIGSADAEEQNFAENILRELENAHVTLW